jgi:hypothetical protein
MWALGEGSEGAVVGVEFMVTSADRKIQKLKTE